MATLIQSKQIEGVVTASVIQGDFQVDSGSVNLSGATGVTGSFSGSFIGDGSQLTFGGTGLVSGSSQITISQTSGYTTFSSSLVSRLVSLENATDNTGSDSQTLSISGDQLTISSGNTITIPTGSGGGASSWSELSGIPSGLISSSIQLTSSFDSRYALSGSSGVSDFTELTNVPSGLVSGSSQLYSDLDTRYALSGSTEYAFIKYTSSENVPTTNSYFVINGSNSGSISYNDSNGYFTLDSGSTYVLETNLKLQGGSWYVSAGWYDVTNSEYISPGNDTEYNSTSNTDQKIAKAIITPSSNIQVGFRVKDNQGSVGAVTIDGAQSYWYIQKLQSSGGSGGSGTSDFTQLTNVPSGLVSSSAQITDGSGILSGSIVDQLPSGIISGSTFTSFSSSVDSRLDTLENATDNTGSDTQTLSISGDQLTISDGNTVTIPTGSGTVPAGTISGSAQITALGFTSGSHTTLPSGLVSSSTQISTYGVFAELNGDNLVSASYTNVNGYDEIRIGDFSGDITNGTSLGASGNRIKVIPNEAYISVSGSDSSINFYGNTNVKPNYGVGGNLNVTGGDLIVSGNISGSSFNGTGLFSGSLVAGTNITINQSGNDFIISSSASGDSIPAGTISSSAQIIDSLPSGVVSGSSQLTSSYDSRYLQTTTYTTDSASFDTRISNIGDHANITPLNLFTQSADLRLDSIESFTSSIDTTIKTKLNTDDVLSGSIESILPSGVISGSTQITDGSGIFSGSLVAGSNITINQVGNNFEISSSASGGGSASVTVSDSAPNSPSQGDLWWKSDDGNLYIYYDGYWVISTDITTGLPAGVVSGSAQITSVITDSYISASAASSGFGSGGSSDFTTLTNVPSGLVSGSSQLTSSYDTRYLNVNGDGVVSGSVLRTLDGTGVVSGSVLRTLDGTGVVSGSVLRTLDGTGVFSGSLVAGNNITINQVGNNFEISSSASGGGSVPAGTVSSSLQTISHLGGTNIFSGSVIGEGSITITSGSGNITISGSGGSSDVSYDGNRIISNEDLGDLFTNSVNPGTSGSIQDFLNAVFYPNNPPSITTGNQTISEYSASNAQIVQLVATDPEGQSLTFGTASSYTDDLVRVSSAGVMTLNALAESSSFNTDSVGGGHGHLVTVTATDTFNSTIEKDIYIIVTPNEAPVFRETSVSGNIITSVTANLNENSANDTLVKRVFFTDTESDTITITTSSIDGNHFDVTVYGTYLDIRQNTGSLDYEQQTTYTFSITASDEHYEAGQDSDSRTFLPVTVNVTDNLVPVVNSQVVGTINENSSNGASVGSISATDNEGDSISFVTFDLHKLLLDGSNVSSGSYGGTSQLTDPHENPFQMDSSGNVTRKTGVYLNSDLINQYQYRVKVRDNYNATISSASVVSINVSDDTPATLSDNWSAGPYIKESEVSGTTIKTTNYGSTQADYNSNQSGTWSSSNSAISINSNGNLSLGVDLSGSVTQSGDTLDSTITFTNTFGTTTTDNLSVTIVANGAPTATFTNQSSNFNTNLATNGTTMVSMSITDTEGDTPYSVSLSGTNASDLQLKYTNVASSSVGIQANGNLSAGTYNYDVVVTDSYSKSTTYSGRSFTVASASTGTLSTNGTLYVIESATNGDNIVLNSNGRTGTQGSVSVAYSPNYGSQSAGSFTSSNGLISINSSTGVLSVGTDISGSGNTNGSTITSTIGWTDQYGNVGSDTITVNVAKNNAPSVSSTQTFNTNTNQATGSSEIVRLNLSDTESDTIPNSSLSFTNYNSTYFTPSISTPQMKLLVNSTSIPAGSYPYTASIEDVHGFETRVHSGSVTISQASTGSLGGDTAIYIIESAESGSVFRDQTGFNQGSPAQLSVSYLPNYGSAVVQSYTSSRQGISVDSSGNLTAGYDFSGSVTSTDYTSTALVSDSTNSTLYDKSLHVNGIKVVQGAATGSQSAVPDAFTEKVAQTIKLMITSSGADINDTDQANMIGILKGETGTWHSGYPTAQRILRGAGSDYSPNPLIDSNYSSYPGLQNFQDSHATDDMIWYLNSSAASGSGDADIVEVIEHLMHTIHQYGVRGAVSGSYNELSWDPDTDSNWNTRELYYAIKEAVDDSVFDISDYGDASYNTASTFKLIAKEYLYLLNFNMWEYSSLWSGGSLSPEWNDNSRTPSGIQTNNPLGYALYNKYIKPVLTKPSKTVLQNIFQDGDVGDPTVAGSSGYTPEVGTGLISKITFRDQYDNIGSGSVTATVFGNSSPSANFTDNGFNSDQAISGSDIGTLTVTDTESNSPFSVTLAGTDGGKFDISGSSSPFTIQPTGSLSAGTYTINITVTDSYSESVTLTGETIVVSQAADYGKVYIYTSTRTGGGTLSDSNYDGIMGITSENTTFEPDLVTGYQSTGPSPLYAFKTGYLGSGSVTVGGGTMTLRNTVSGSNLDTIISSSFNGSGGSEQIMIIFPSGSDMDGIPTSMTDTLGGSTNGEYVLYLKAAGESSYTAAGSQIHMFDVDSAVEGYTRWNIIGRNSANAAGSYEVRLIPSSGSAP